ncbi:hypothetical protein J6590_049044 [Homalodisca vitripennis]|nr:hypothetical protein J6590_049044 [Homalodisca vitripennis]
MFSVVRLTVKTRSQSRNEARPEEKFRSLDTVEEEPPIVEECWTPQSSPEYDCAQRPRTGSETETSLQEESSEDIFIEEAAIRPDRLNKSFEFASEAQAEEESDGTMAEARGLTIIPGRFRGGIEENVEEYLTQFDRVAKANGWDENKKKVILPCYLEAAALKWYENMEGTMGDGLTWAQIRDGLKETFQGIAWEEQVEYRLRMRMQANGAAREPTAVEGEREDRTRD